MIKLWDFVKGIILRVTAYDAAAHDKEGAVYVESGSPNKIKTYIGGAKREVLTDTQAQTVTNKTIVAGSNTISGLQHGTQVDNLTVAHGATGAVVGTTNTQTLTNKKLDDTTTAFVDTSDATKQLQFNVGGTTGTTTTIISNPTTSRNLTLPDVTTTLVGEIGSQTLFNKSLIAGTTSIVDGVDPTRRIMFNPASATTGTVSEILGNQTANRQITLPDATTTLVGNDATQTLTNKIINADLNTITNIDNNEIKAGAGIDATKIADGSVTSTEFQFINSLTSNAQTQINNKADSSTVTAHIGASSGVHGTTGFVVGTTDTQTLTNKTFDDALTEKQIVTPSNPSSGYNKVYFKADNNLYKLDSSGNETVFSGGSTFLDNVFAINDSTDATKQIKFNAGGTTNTATTLVGSQTSNISINLPNYSTTIPGNVMFGAYSTNAGQVYDTTTRTIVYEDLIGATNSDYNTSSGALSISKTGKLSLTASLRIQATAFTTAQNINIVAVLNGTNIKRGVTFGNGGTNSYVVSISLDGYPVTNGDTLVIKGDSSVATNLLAAAQDCSFTYIIED